jgi:hypothetical protein
MYLLWWVIVIIGVLLIYVFYLIAKSIIITRASRKIFDRKLEDKKK